MESEGSDHQWTAKAHFDQEAFNYTPSQFATSYAGSMSGAGKHKANHEDDEQSKVSFYTSYTTATGDDRLVRTERGREFNTLSENYTLPTDVDEWDRLDKQHRAITLGLGGLYPAREVVRAILAPQDGATKKIVDIGCGTGIWSTEMAREFPHCDVLGVDLAPVPVPAAGLPPNCRFEMDDVNLGLMHLRGQYDVVFARAIALGLKDFRKSLADIEACLKPGGIMIWVEADYDLYSGWPMEYRPFWSSSNPDGSYTQRVWYEFQRAASFGNSDLPTMAKVIDEGFWTNSTNIDPTTCQTASLYLPIGTWCTEGDQLQKEQLRYVGMLMRQDISETSRSTQPLFLKIGWSKEEIDRWGVRMREECQNDTLALRARIAWGRSREGPNLPAPALRGVSLPDTEESYSKPKYPFYEVFDTPEQALAAAAVRNRNKDIPAPPFAGQ